jgi:hypothetical protein
MKPRATMRQSASPADAAIHADVIVDVRAVNVSVDAVVCDHIHVAVGAPICQPGYCLPGL